MSEPKPMSAAMQADIARWEAAKQKQVAQKPDTFEAVRDQMVAVLQTLPENPEIPYHLTDEGIRWDKFKRVCDPFFLKKIDYALVKNPKPFNRVVEWDGTFPGLCASGLTGYGKTFSAWQALRRLYVIHNRTFAWFPVRKLVTDLQKYEDNNCAEDFFRSYDFFNVLFVDDLDKINWQFDSHLQMLFSFFDWAYRTKKPVVATTNNNRAWWTKKAGEAFARRLFVDACVGVEFSA